MLSGCSTIPPHIPHVKPPATQTEATQEKQHPNSPAAGHNARRTRMRTANVVQMGQDWSCRLNVRMR